MQYCILRVYHLYIRSVAIQIMMHISKGQLWTALSASQGFNKITVFVVSKVGDLPYYSFKILLLFSFMSRI